MDPSTAIAVNQVAKIFGSDQRQVVALDYVSVDIRENEFFTLLGPSGCGKTTLLRLIAGFEHPSSGSIALHGKDITNLPPFRRPVNTVFQSYALFPHMTVAENIGFGLEMQDKPTQEIKNTVEKMLDLVQMTELADRRTDQISGGQQQRVALARALAPHPKVLLLDEPLSALDYKLRKEMQIELKRLQNETGITFVFVTHDQEEALTMSDRVAVMNHGKILQTGTPKDIYNHPTERFVADFIGDTNFISVEILPDDGSVRSIKLPSGRLLSHAIPEELCTGPATVAIRPEQATLHAAFEEADVEGVLNNIVYSGNDTHFHIELTSGEPFVVRVQSRGSQDVPLEMGQRVGIVFDPDSTQLLRD